MQIHARISQSLVNGPGRRAVLWFQGCTLHCPGCWNPKTHAFDVSLEYTVRELADWILCCPNIEGVTFSGGEPFQQAEALLELCQELRANNPALSLGVFSGYTIRELTTGRWHYRVAHDPEWYCGTPTLFEQIKAHLDFGVFGRFVRARLTSSKPLCGSENQEVVFFADRYSIHDLSPQSCEIHISPDGEAMTVTGFPSAELIQSLTQH
jgi:anaerobic ribonucleoside-triphosphate reductase activating protein